MGLFGEIGVEFRDLLTRDRVCASDSARIGQFWGCTSLTSKVRVLLVLNNANSAVVLLAVNRVLGVWPYRQPNRLGVQDWAFSAAVVPVVRSFLAVRERVRSSLHSGFRG
ncbi:hypothetical protein BaRGS_00039537 [Batillaria attramentaria]|uniref:Uncharacterized protein n=1 Tax=Batillaria attramentaria TaxID=370345 RepID=A0ABD0J3C8_9CAEN